MLNNPAVFRKDSGDGSAEFTISVDEADHRFSASPDGDKALVQYDETLTWRGQICVSEPAEYVFKLLMQSDKMTEYLEANDLNGIRRQR
jgi:hypothetical protein